MFRTIFQVLSLVLLALSIHLAMIYFKDKEFFREEILGIKPAPVFHIKVKQFDDCYWRIFYTNNNFKTEEAINETYLVFGYPFVHRGFFSTYEEASEVAKRLNTYEKCAAYNDSVNAVYKKEFERISKDSIFVRYRKCDKPNQEHIIY